MRTPLIDPLKAVAAQLIVLHHLAFYGPMSDVVYAEAPRVVDWFYDYARMAVQIFLVVGGFLAAMALTPNGAVSGASRRIQPIKQLVRRYLRLVLPYVGALLITVLAAGVARQLMQHDSIPAAPTLGQFLSHIFLLHDVLDQDALSVGVWYVAIDFQLFGMFVLCAWLAQCVAPYVAERQLLILTLLVGVLAVVSLVYVNRLPEWDSWAVYFFGSYALGVFAYWAANARSVLWALAPMAIGIVAMWVESRTRIGVATATALVLILAHRYRHVASAPSHRWMRLLGESSYALFLLHFSVFLIVNAVVHRFAPGTFWPSLMGLVATWVLSNVAGILFHLQVERRMRFGLQA